MTSNPRNRFDRALSGGSAQEELRSTFPKDGDPQDAALTQFLTSRLHTLSPTDAIADVGCGRAILASAILYVLKDTPAPRYIAIEKAEFIDGVALPAGVHNNSEKLPYEVFMALNAPRSDIKLAVIRNVLHELEIAECAELLVALCRSLDAGTELFIQDMETLARVEPRFAGWSLPLLSSALSTMGFKPRPYQLASHSGNTWFGIECTVPLEKVDLQIALPALMEARRQQATQMEKQLHELKRVWSNESVSEFQVVAQEHSALLVQLGTASGHSATFPREVSGKGRSVPLRPAEGRMGVSFDNANDRAVERSGILGVIFNKDSVDIPALLEGAKQRVWFWGYSLAPMFRYPANIVALRNACGKSIPVRLLLCDPDSLAAQSRAEQRVYQTDQELRSEINSTIADAIGFRQAVGDSGASLEVRTSSTIPPCSAFGVDDVAVFSLYSPALRGGLAPCFVASEVEEPRLSYFTILRSDFDVAWAAGRDVLSAPDV